MVGQASAASITLAWRILEEGSDTFLGRRTEVILLHFSFLREKKQEQAVLPFRDGSHRRLGRGLAPSSRHSSLWYWKKPPVRVPQMPVSCSPIIAVQREKLQGQDIDATRKMQII